MATEVDICNMSLARLGDEANISSITPPDNSVQANYCSTFYPIALREAIDSHNWTFSKRRFQLPQITNESKEWQYCYSIPPHFINIVEIFRDNLIVDDYVMEISTLDKYVIYCNYDQLTLIYNSSDIIAGIFPPAFVRYLSTVLCSHLAGPMIKGNTGASASDKFLRLAVTDRERAVESDSKNHTRYIRPVPEFIMARR